MFQNIENLKLLRILRIVAAPQPFNMVNRPDHALILKIKGETAYSFENQTLHFKDDEVLFVPKGSTYLGKHLSSEGESLYICFDADIPPTVPQVHSLDGYLDLEYLYDHLEQLWLLGGQAGQHKCYSIFYNLLSFISTKKSAEYAYQKKLEKIKPAVDYLQSHMFHYDLKVDHLHLLCGVSDTYFRKIFKANFGVTPQDYITNARMTRALNRILSRHYTSISEVALSVGYKDALYFSRLFSKKYGVSPSNYVQEFPNN